MALLPTPHPRQQLAWLCLLLLLGVSAASRGAMEVVELQYRPPSLLLPELDAVAQDTAVTASGNRLILNGDAEEIVQLVGLIRELDQPLAQYRIHVRQSGGEQLQADQWNVSGQLRTTTQPGTQIRTTTADRSSGSFTLHSSSTTHRVTTTVGQFSRGSSRGASQQVRALEGMPAYIETGLEIPFLNYYAGPQGYSQQQQYEPVVTGFYVTPSPAWNDQVQLEISVRDERYNGSTDNTIDSRGLATSVRAPLGQWIDLGSSLQQQAQEDRRYTGAKSGQSTSAYHIELMVERSD